MTERMHKFSIEAESMEDIKPYCDAIDNLIRIEDCDNYLRGQAKHGDWPENVIDMIDRAREILRGL